MYVDARSDAGEPRPRLGERCVSTAPSSSLASRIAAAAGAVRWRAGVVGGSSESSPSLNDALRAAPARLGSVFMCSSTPSSSRSTRSDQSFASGSPSSTSFISWSDCDGRPMRAMCT